MDQTIFKETMRKNLERMIYEHRRSFKGFHPDKDVVDICPWDQCCRICFKLFPEWAKWIDENGLDPSETGNHPCNYYGGEYVKRIIKEVILNE